MLEWIALITAVLATAPMRLSLRVDVGGKPSFAVALYVYGICLRFRGPIPRAMLRDILNGPQIPFRLSMRDLFFFFYHLFEGAQWSKASAVCRVGTGDAYSTALLTGMLSALLGAAGSTVGLRAKVKPEFNRPFFVLSIRCILSFRGGDIIRAGAKTLSVRRPMKRKVEIANGQASH
ncbi:MAG: DUF2953 domain-containing protein [Firmicutes bacterium]|nr:DUF2953 domain-containing protein [Bacillota bacterium]